MEYDISNLINKLNKSGYKYDIDKINRAFLFAKELHQGQYRKSGEEYIIHPIAVAEIVADLELDTESICAALLHDTIEDCSDRVDLETIRSNFGAQVAEIVDGLTKLVSIPYEDKEEQHIENLRKMFLAMSKDLRVIFIKLCDRLHNMRTLASMPEEKQRIIALETMNVYAPLAHRLGIDKIKQELEGISLRYLDPIGYQEVVDDTKRKYGVNRSFLDNAQKRISDRLRSMGIDFAIEGRVKSVYSIYKKMFNQNKSFDEIYDFYAIRILVNTELECYTILGVIHEMFNSMPGRFKDYISTPKPNMYQALHTTVIGRDGIPFEVQIRTWEMHSIAEFGLAAHWKYKSGVSGEESIDKKLEWIRTLVETEKDSTDPDEFLRRLKIDIFEDETFVFTPKGDVVNLPSGSTAIDFAYAIHTQVGHKMIGVKINGNICPIDTVLKTGQIVDILTSTSSKGPNRDWLKIAKTSEARNKIRQWFKKEHRAENIEEAKNDIRKELNKFKIPYTDSQFNEICSNVAGRMGINDVDDFYNGIGYGGISFSKILQKLKDEFDRTVKPTEDAVPFADIESSGKPIAAPPTQSVIVDGIDNCAVKFARCCAPLPGDAIIGFITKGYGISIHKYDCPNAVHGLQSEDRDRWVSARWATAKAANAIGGFDSIITIFAHNSYSLLANISSCLAEMRVRTISINSRIKENSDDIIITLSIRAKNTEHFTSIVSRLGKIKDVYSVIRGHA